ncbi:MAG: glycosyltransferase family 9 protein [Terriglobales bacterium]
MSREGNYLIVKLAAAGDVLLTTAMARALRCARPQAVIGWITSGYAAPLLEGNPDVDSLLTIPAPGAGAVNRARAAAAWWAALGAWKRRFGPATVLVAHRSAWLGRSARMRGHRAVAWGAEVPYRLDRHRLALQSELLAAAGVDAGATTLRPRLALQANELAEGEALWEGGPGPRWALAPGGASNPWSAMPNRCWPRERFVELAARAQASGISLSWLGGAADAGMARWLDERLPAASQRNWIGRLSLRQSAAVIAAADLVIGNDSLPLVMAQALERPSVGIYGPTAGERIHAPGQPFVQGWAGCGPCYDPRAGREGMAYVCPRARCLEQVSVEEVWRAARRPCREDVRAI